MSWESGGRAGLRPANQSPIRVNQDNSGPFATLPTRLTPSTRSTRTTRTPSLDVPMLSASSSNNHSLFSFGPRSAAPAAAEEPAPLPFEFLPSVNFDDLHSSLQSVSSDFKHPCLPSTLDQGGIKGASAPAAENMVERPGITQNGGSTRVAPPSRGRSGSVLRRPSTSDRNTRQSSISSSVSSSSTHGTVPSAPAAMRAPQPRRYPPVSSTNTIKPPRKSMGPGILERGSELDCRAGQATSRRLSMVDRDSGLSSTRSSVDGGSRLLETTQSVLAKARPRQAPLQNNFSRSTTTSSLDPSSLVTPDTSRTSMAFPRSPRTSNAKGSTPLTAKAKRMSTHASGLGARTISPTDTQRMKRMSMRQPASNGNNSQGLSPALSSTATLPSEIRASSRSPSMIPRKTSTPSSVRTTPEINRKSYSSGLSIASANSFNTLRTSTSSIQGRNAQANGTRLQAPKAGLGLHGVGGHGAGGLGAGGLDEDEDVPPVPAIPKAYESPKESPADMPFLDKRRSNLAVDTSSLRSNNSGASSSGGARSSELPQPPAPARRRTSNRKSIHSSKPAVERSSIAAHHKKGLEPLRLPPLNLGPLSTPTAAKIAALQDQASSDGKHTPSSRLVPKTPTTPLTASRSFFSRITIEEKHALGGLRSSSSTQQQLGFNSPSGAEATSSSESIIMVPAANADSQRQGVSPYLSSSVPKDGNLEAAFRKRSKTGGDYTLPLEPVVPLPQPLAQQHKPSGPRAPRAAPEMMKPEPSFSAAVAKTVTKPGKSPPSLSSPDEAPTPSSMSSLRQKLSMSWKRSASKASISQSLHVVDKGDEKDARQDIMPPPRIPKSATHVSHSLAKPLSPSPSLRSNGTGGYLETRRRKGSASSLNASSLTASTAHDPGLKKESSLNTVSERSSLQRLIKPKASTTSVRDRDGLDRDDLVAEEEMKRLASRRKQTDLAARTLDALRQRATAKERASAQEAIRMASLNIYERGEIVDYKDVYFCGTQNAAKVVGNVQSNSPNYGYDDERGDYSIVPGDHLAYRYEIIDVLGKGSFGQVVRCIDHKDGTLVALKIIRNKKRFHQQALVEVNILKKLREWDPKNQFSMVNFTHSFYFRGHLCISTELLDMNLYEFIKSNAFRGFSLKMIRRFTKQMLSSLNLLKQHKVIHCDLKPENILLRHPRHTEIKVIDFGSSCFENEKVYTYIQSRFYRSPEVILGMTYGLPIDMWSLGCILAELYTGVPIFPGENEQEQLACIMEVFGPPEKHLIEKSTRKKIFFDSHGKPRMMVSSKGRRRKPSTKTLHQVLKCDDEPFLDFIASCLRWDPERRLKPEDAVRHEFITGQPQHSLLGPPAGVPARTSGSLRDSSPSKRILSGNSTSGPRPLPEPPVMSFKPLPTSLRQRDNTVTGNAFSTTPLKPSVGAARRTSAAVGSGMATNGSTISSIGSIKRSGTTSGVSGAGAALTSSYSSNLPRVSLGGPAMSTRNFSGGRQQQQQQQQDIATAGATAAMMSRRA